MPFFEADGLPLQCNVLSPTAHVAASAPRGPIRLAVCPSCGLAWNQAFDPAQVLYSPEYENSLHFSARFQRYADALADRLVCTYGLAGRTVLDVGCGKGDFLRLICRGGRMFGLGMDESCDEPDPKDASGPVSFVRRRFSGDDPTVSADLICCRHVLEHVPFPRRFVGELRRVALRRPESIVFVEVPNLLYTLRDLGIWDIIYEHCSYFTAISLRRLFSRAGFDLITVEPAYGGQFVCLEARPGISSSEPHDADAVTDIVALAARFSRRYARTVARWAARLAELQRAGRRVVLWGAGSKGVTFLNTVPGAAAIREVVDLNPRKHGRFVAGGAQRVVPPSALTELRPEVVLVMNPLYVEEIAGCLRTLSLAPSVETV